MIINCVVILNYLVSKRNMNIATLNKISILVILLFPKINLISISGYDQGIRLDDFLIVILTVIYIGKFSNINRTAILILFYITLSLFINFFNNENLQLVSLLHYTRYVEYFLLFTIVSKIFDNEDIYKIVLFAFLFEILFTIFEFVLPISDNARIVTDIFGYTVIRANGTFAGPWELSIFMGICFFILSDYSLRYNNRNFYKFSLLTWTIIFASFARAQFIALIISHVFQENINKLFKFLIIIIFSIFSLVILFSEFEKGQFSFGYIDFSTTVNFIKDYGKDIFINWSKGDFYLGTGGRYFDASASIYDPSLVSRLQQWGNYLQTFDSSIYYPISLLFGMGPGSGGIINDGMFIKVFVDFGLVGFLIFAYYNFRFVLRNDTRALTIFLLISCLTLDIYWASKIGYITVFAIVYFNNSLNIKKIKKTLDTAS